MSNLINIITVLRDVALASAAVVGAVVAVKGLNAWRKQLRGTAEYELARRLLRAAYKLREATTYVRSPIMMPSEMALPEEEGTVEEMSEARRRWLGTGKGYERRWEKIVEARSELDAELLEAEVHWGNQINSLFSPLYKHLGELQFEISMFIDGLNPDSDTQVADGDNARRRMQVMYATGKDDDPFLSDLNKDIAPIEELLKPHLRVP